MSAYTFNRGQPPATRPSAAVWALVISILCGSLAIRTARLPTLPPGLFFDEGYYGLDALRNIQDGQWRLWYGGNNGREPLFIDLASISFAAFGASAWALRMVSVLGGVLAVAAVIRLSADLWSERAQDRPIAWLAGAAIAFQLWPLLLSRDGFRAFWVVPLGTLAVWRLWRAYRVPSSSNGLIAGVVLGLSLYTYLSARILPIAWAIFIAVELGILVKRSGWRAAATSRLFRAFGLTVLAAIVTFIPLGLYFVSHPATFIQRAGDVSILSGPWDQTHWQALVDNVTRVLRMFVDQGDPNPRHNLPGRPALDLVATAGFWTGLGICLIDWRRASHRWLLIWLAAMLAPTVVTTEAPHFLRSVGAIPPVMLLVGVGLWRLTQAVRAPRRFGVLASGAVLAAAFSTLSGAVTVVDYFNTWAHLPGLTSTLGYEVPVTEAVQETVALMPTHDILVPATLYNHPAFRFGIEARLRTLPGSWSGRDVSRPVAVVRLSPAVAPDEPVAGWIAMWRGLDGVWRSGPVQPVDPVNNDPGIESPGLTYTKDTGLVALTENATAPFRDAVPTHEVFARFGDEVELWGYDLEPNVAAPGSAVLIRLYWRALSFSNQDLTVYTQLQTVPDTRLLDQNDSQPVAGRSRVTLWRPGEVVVDTYQLDVPGDAQPGKLIVIAGLYENVTIRRIDVYDASGVRVSDHILLGAITLPATGPQPTAAQPVDFVAGTPPTIAVAGVTLPTQPLRAGDQLDMTLFWKSIASVDKDYTVFVHVLDDAGQLVAQADAPPAGGRSPTSLWLAGEVTIDQRSVVLPPNLPAGTYHVSFGLYDPVSGARLPWHDASGTRLADDRVILDVPVHVVAP